MLIHRGDIGGEKDGIGRELQSCSSIFFFFFSSNVSLKKVGRLHAPPIGFALHDYYPFAFAKEKKTWVAGDIRSEHTSTEQVLDRDPVRTLHTHYNAGLLL